MPKYILAHDVGTSGNKAVLVDTEGHVHGTSTEPYQVYYPRPDWAEQQPEDWWNAVTRTTRSLLEKTGCRCPGKMSGFTVQRFCQ